MRPEFRAYTGNKLFAGIPPATLEQLATIPTSVQHPSEIVIFDEGDPADCFFLIADGGVRISKRGRGGRQESLSHFRGGDFFGEMAIYDPAPRSAQATTTEPTSLGHVDESGFRQMLELAPVEISSNLTRETIRRLRRMDALLIEELLEAERLSLIGSMAGDIIHDFKNPISVISGTVQLLEKRTEDPSLTKYAGMIRRSVDRMLSMAQELLDFSRGVTSLDIGAVTVSDLLDELDEQALHLLSESGIRVERRIGFGGTVAIDRSRFVRLLLNVVRNSAEAMRGGGDLRLTVEGAAGEVRFIIEDTGGGVPEEILPTVFEPFVTRGKAGGTGLGMSIAKAVADAHGGRITIANTGVGARTTICIPAAQGA